MDRRNAVALAETLQDVGGRAPAVARVLAALPLREMSASEALCWWTAANGWLGNRRPIDVINDDPDEVERAASRLGEPSPLKAEARAPEDRSMTSLPRGVAVLRT
jgi:hypothetical protein